MKKEIPIINQEGIEDDGIIHAENILKHPLPKHIQTALVIFDPRPSAKLLEKCSFLYDFVAGSSILPQYIFDNQIVLAFSPLGGPAAGGLIEELLAMGIQKVIACGSSGLIGDMDSSDFLIVEQAIRDEGLSYHYLPPSVYVDTDPDLSNLIKNHFNRLNISYQEGITWTTDAFYKETKAKIALRKKQGALAVEMECASMAAVCAFRQKSFAQVLYFSDIVHQDTWSGFRKDRQQVKEQINQVMIDLAVYVNQQ